MGSSTASRHGSEQARWKSLSDFDCPSRGIVHSPWESPNDFERPSRGIVHSRWKSPSGFERPCRGIVHSPWKSPSGFEHLSPGTMHSQSKSPSDQLGRSKSIGDFHWECTIPRQGRPGRSKSPGLVKIQTWLILPVVVCAAWALPGH